MKIKKWLLSICVVLILSMGFNFFLINFIIHRQEAQKKLVVFENANSRDTYFTIHNVRPAQTLATGKEIKVGILDQHFGYADHPELYAGGMNYGEAAGWELSEHGYWMAQVLKEIAPDAEVYALNIDTRDDERKVYSMVDAIHWAVEHELDVLTYSSARIEEQHKRRLNAAVEYAHQNGIVTTFIHYDHPGNILPDGLFAYKGAKDYNLRAPDLNIFHYDYNTLFLQPYWESQNLSVEDPMRYEPFLSISSTSPVTAGFVALLRSLDGELTPAECKQILMKTSRAMNYKGQGIPRVPDIYAAVQYVLGE